MPMNPQLGWGRVVGLGLFFLFSDSWLYAQNVNLMCTAEKEFLSDSFACSFHICFALLINCLSRNVQLFYVHMRLGFNLFVDILQSPL
jgi:hypothetical protein